MVDTKKDRFVSIGKIVKTQGNKGEVAVDLLTDFPDRFAQLDTVGLRYADDRLEERAIEHAWPHKGRMIVKFAGSERIGDAERMVGCEIQIPESDLRALPSGTYYDFQLIGCRVCDTKGQCIGEVKEILKIPSNDVLVVAAEDGEVLIPAVETFCRVIDVEKKEIVVSLPEGLDDLNK